MVAADAPLPDLPLVELEREPLGGRVLTGIGAAVDASLLRAMQLVVERALIPDPENVRRVRDSARALLEPELQRDPARFFDHPESTGEAGAFRSRVLRRVRGGRVRECRMVSGYQPRLAVENAAERSDVVFEHWRRDGDTRGTILLLHGFTMGRPRFDAFALFANAWYRSGLDVALLTLPYHGVRRPRGARFSGEHFASPDVARLSEAVREAIFEISLVTRWLREQSGRPVGLLGLSLGGYLTALAASLLDDLDFAIPMAAPACIGDLAWGFFEQTRYAREGGAATLSREELRRSFRVHSPLAHTLRLPKERVLVVGGRGDRIVPPRHPAALWSHWGEPAIHWFSGSHLAPFGRGGIVRAVTKHLASLGIL